MIGVLTQRDPAVDEPLESDLYGIGHAHPHPQDVPLPGRLAAAGGPGDPALPHPAGHPVPPVPEGPGRARQGGGAGRAGDRGARRSRRARARFFQRVVELSPTLSDELATLAGNIQEPARLADFIAGSLPTLNTAQKQELLETIDVRARLERVNKVLVKDLEVLEVGSKIQSQVKSELQKNQREYYLREQMKAIQKELGDSDDQQREISELREKIEAAGHAGGGQEGGACASSSGSRACRRPRPSTPSRAPTSTGWSRCPGASAPRARSTWSRPRKSSTTTTTTSRRSRTASSSTWPCAR